MAMMAASAEVEGESKKRSGDPNADSALKIASVFFRF